MLGVALFFGTLSFCAAFNIPQGLFEGEMTSSVSVLDWLVHTVATDNFGQIGGAVFYGVLGLFAVAFTLVATSKPKSVKTETKIERRARRRKEQPIPDRASSAPDKERSRRRNLVAAAIIANEAIKPAQDKSASVETGGSSHSDAASVNPAESTELDELTRVSNLYSEALNYGLIPSLAADPAEQPLPAWGLILASPWEDVSGHTSWLGGLPCAPDGFEWPRDPSNNKPMHFYAQIDLSELEAESETGAGAPGLPKEGALLVFIGLESAVRVISADDMKSANVLVPPDDLPTLEEYGYWTEAKTFPAWPITPRAFLDHPYDEDAYWEEFDGELIPEAFRQGSKEPADWINNWGMAAFEAEQVVKGLRFPVEDAHRRFEAELQKITAQDEAAKDDDGAETDQASAEDRALEAIGSYAAKFLTDGPAMVQELKDWKERAEGEDPLQPIDAELLDRLFQRRLAFCENLNGTGPVLHLKGREYDVWQQIWFGYRSDDPMVSLRDMPEAFQGFMEQRITGWRKHRLFGIEPPFSNNMDDLRGKACLISINADPLLCTQTEHEYGISVWIPAEEMKAGNFENTQVVRHCAV